MYPKMYVRYFCAVAQSWIGCLGRIDASFLVCGYVSKITVSVSFIFVFYLGILCVAVWSCGFGFVF